MHMGTTTAGLVILRAGRTVHPHAHGDNRETPDRSNRACRFTPMHMGTTLAAGRPRFGCPRFTPMHMGTTRRSASPTCCWAVHPHAHGDNGYRAADEPLGFRFTPMHMGTTSSATPPILGPPRFTPMHMGTTPPPGPSPSNRSVHPHAHGDNRTPWLIGKLPFRFTPMHMGTTSGVPPAKQHQYGSPPCTWGQRFRRPRSADRSAVHPHAHGDNVAGHAVQNPGCRFTPMHMGTTSRTPHRQPPDQRFTPMHMGTTRTSPRSAVAVDGSPPCTWGQREQSSSHLAHIPVHPHAHGDNLNFRYS